ncbi:MAG: ComF family protein [Alphaproteobacteria bacterium]
MKHIYAQTCKIASSAIDIVLPPRCPVNGQLVDVQGMISHDAWTKLEFITAPYCTHCGVPFDFETSNDEKCMDCLTHPPVYDSARAALRYNDTSRDLILGFKHGDKTHVAPSFVPWLQRCGAGCLPNAAYLIPVPLHPKRLLVRRYNQAAVIAHNLSKEVGIPHLSDAMRRVRATPSQGHLSGGARARNVAKAFDVMPRYRDDLKGKSVILMDDVYTTGATVNECTKTLKQYGVSHVHVLTLARVLNEEDSYGL